MYLYLTMLQNLKEICPSITEELCSQSLPIDVLCQCTKKQSESNNSHEIVWNEMAIWYDQLHKVSKNPTKLERNQSSGHRGVAFTIFRHTEALTDKDHYPISFHCIEPYRQFSWISCAWEFVLNKRITLWKLLEFDIEKKQK